MIIIKLVLTIIFLPLVLLKDTITVPRPWVKRIILAMATLVVFGGLWWVKVQNIIEVSGQSLFEAGVTDRLTSITVSGTSMLPNIKDGDKVDLHSPKKYPPKRGDLVSFINDETEKLHYLKRVIGLPGETLLIRRGGVFINGKALKENYVLNKLPTYGNSFLLDCQPQVIPEDSYAVLGDNRTVSHDSRAIGFVATPDIDGVIPSQDQPQFSESEAIFEKKGSVELSAAGFLKLLNTKRQDQKLGPLATHTLLNDLARQRSEQIKDNFNDWKQQKSSVEELLNQRGYRYNLVHEFTTFGYLDEEAIVNQIFDSPFQKELFLSGKFTEAGIGTSIITDGECEFPLITVILSWPSVPTYDQSVIDYWSKENQTTVKVLADLQTWVGFKRIDQEKLRTVINNISEASIISGRVADRMKKREWLSGQDYADIKRYQPLIEDNNRMMNELFGPQVKGVSTEVPDLLW